MPAINGIVHLHLSHSLTAQYSQCGIFRLAPIPKLPFPSPFPANSLPPFAHRSLPPVRACMIFSYAKNMMAAWGVVRSTFGTMPL